MDFYSQQNKLFLTHLFESIEQDGERTADQELLEIILGQASKKSSEKATIGLESISVDAPLKLPLSMTSKHQCQGYEHCKEKEITWMWSQYKKQKRKKVRTKIFTPYTQRVVEYYLATEGAPELPPLEAMGSNTAPIAARAQYLIRLLARKLPKIKILESYPALSVLRIGQSLKIARSHLLHYKHQAGGEESRQVILDHLLEGDFIFIYHQDYQRLIHNLDAFEAFFCALTGFLKFMGLNEKPPKDLPLKQGWIEIPGKDVKGLLEP